MAERFTTRRSSVEVDQRTLDDLHEDILELTRSLERKILYSSLDETAEDAQKGLRHTFQTSIDGGPAPLTWSAP